jgi:hypothetical protein
MDHPWRYSGAGLQIFNRSSHLHEGKALPTVALLEADQGRIERGFELYALACETPPIGNPVGSEDIPGTQIARLCLEFRSGNGSSGPGAGKFARFLGTVKGWRAELSRKS